jgi:mitofusin 2
VVGGFGWVDGALGAMKVVGNNNIRKLIIPGVIVTGKPPPYSLNHS